MAEIRNSSEANELWHSMAGLVFSCVEQANLRNWSVARLSVVCAEDGSSWTMKLRVDRGVEKGLSVGVLDELSDAIGQVVETKSQFFDPVWYGFTLSVSASGDCDVAFNYDPDCENDRAFYNF